MTTQTEIVTSTKTVRTPVQVKTPFLPMVMAILAILGILGAIFVLVPPAGEDLTANQRALSAWSFGTGQVA